MKKVILNSLVLLLCTYLAVIFKNIYVYFFSVFELESYGFEWRLKQFWNRVIPLTFENFIGMIFEFLKIIPVFIITFYFAKNKFQLYILPCIVGAVLSLILPYISGMFVNLDMGKTILGFIHILLCFSIPYLFLHLSYSYIVKKDMNK